MKKFRRRALGLTLYVALASSTFAQGTAFTHQGRLERGGTPYTGSAEFQATLWNPSSDRNLKENFTPVDPQEVLAKVAALPISRWNFIDDSTTPHVGPMAQDFHTAFGVGTDEKHIATVDADGVALAAIQGLSQILQQKETEITELKQRLPKLEQQLDKNTQ